MRSILSALALVVLAAPALAADRPNIVVMMTDDQRHDYMSCAGHPFLKTPNMDRIAKEGFRYTNAFVTNALCAPSRATLMTGQYSHLNGVRDNMGTTLNPNAPWLPDELRKLGYEVAFCGKSHVPGHFRDKTWDYYFGFQGQGNYLKPLIAESGPDGKIGPDKPYDGWIDDVVTDKALAWVKKPRAKPFALFLFFKSPHRAWQPAARHKELYAGAAVKRPALWDDPGQGKPRAFLQAANMIGQYPDTKDYDGMIRDYARCITGVDDNVGKVLNTLDEQKIADTTAVMYTSDNGFFLGEWQRFDKRFMHEPSVRVPLLLKVPKALAKECVPPGSQPSAMVINPDIAPTVLELAGGAPPKAMQGRSILPFARATPAGPLPPEMAPREAWYYEYFEFPDPSHNVEKQRGVRTTKWKLIHYYDPPFKFKDAYELYDLEKDPEERVNLANRPAFQGTVKELQEKMAALRKELGSTDAK
ncbi:sulfatase [Gemmata sp. JC673]|uniref:Sulfatase n=1 Tax=Gemmata algarum TaxID=2975278 RepID=A0ABU5ETN2_9BACT|nr:sulfatase [Gemmata algarum]MDY3558678.1 sulfatase [Gemmata algarum]